VLRELLRRSWPREVSYQPAVLPLVVRAGAGSVRDALSTLDQLLAGPVRGADLRRTVALLGYTDDSLLDEMMEAFRGRETVRPCSAPWTGWWRAGMNPRRFAADLLDGSAT